MRPAFVVLFGVLGSTLLGCTAFGSPPEADSGAAPLRGFGVDVVQAVSDRVPLVHVKTCGDWGCDEQDVELHISGPVSPLPCETPEGGSKDDAACGIQQLDGPGPGYGYLSVPKLTTAPVTVTVTTPAGAEFPIHDSVRVRPRSVDGVAQANLRIDADGRVTQSR
jgi:hypothetical protein